VACAGFVPFKQLAPGRLIAGHKGELEYLVGQRMRAKVMTVRGCLRLAHSSPVLKCLVGRHLGANVMTAQDGLVLAQTAEKPWEVLGTWWPEACTPGCCS
jgi:hypothetical protein